MHAAVGEDVVHVGEDVVCCERDKLASTPKNTPEEVVGIEVVGEPHNEADGIPIVGELLHAEHHRRTPGEVAVAGGEEELGELPCTPPPRDRPHP